MPDQPNQNSRGFTAYYKQFIGFQNMKLSDELQKYRQQFLMLLQGGCKVYAMPIAEAQSRNYQDSYVWDEQTNRLSYIHKAWGKINLVRITEEEDLSFCAQKESPTLIKQGEKYFFYGNPDGTNWEFTALESQKIEAMNIDFNNDVFLDFSPVYQQVYQEVMAYRGHIAPQNLSLSGYQAYWMSADEAKKLKMDQEKGLLEPHLLLDNRIYLTHQGDVLKYWIKDASNPKKVFSDALSMNALKLPSSASTTQLKDSWPAILEQISQKGHTPFNFNQERQLADYMAAHRDQLQNKRLYLPSKEAKKLIPLYQSYFSSKFSSYLLHANVDGIPFPDFSDMHLRTIKKNNVQTWFQYFRLTSDDAHLKDLNLPMDKPTLIQVQEGTKSHFYIYGNTQGYEWKLNSLDAAVVAKAEINFPDEGVVTTLVFDKKYAALYEYIVYGQGRHTPVATDPERFAQIKNMFNAVYYAELVLRDLENMGTSMNATTNVVTRETSANAYKAISILTEFGVDIFGAFGEEIQQMVSLLSSLNQTVQPYLLGDTKQNSLSSWPRLAGQGVGIAIDKMNPNPTQVDFDFIAQFSALLPSYIDRVTGFLHKYAYSETTGAGFTEDKIKDLRQDGLQFLNTLENFKQGASFSSTKVFHVIKLLSQITTLSMKALDEINHLSNESQEGLRGLLSHAKYQLLPELFGAIDKIEEELMLQPGLLSKPVMQSLTPWYDFLIFYAKSPINFALKGEELLEIEDSFFIKKRIQLVQKRADVSHQILFQVGLDRAHAQVFFTTLSHADDAKMAVGELPATTKQVLLTHYKALESYIKKSDPELNDQIIRHLKGSHVKPILSIQTLLGFEAKLNAIFSQMCATENLKLRLADDMVQSLQETSTLTVFPFHHRIGFDLHLMAVDEKQVLDELSLPQDKPTLIQQGSKYFVYGNGQGTTWGFTPLNAHVIDAQKLSFDQHNDLLFDARPNYKLQFMPEGLPEGFILLPNVLYVTVVDDMLEYMLVDEQESTRIISNEMARSDLGYFEDGITQASLELCLPDILKITQARGETTPRYQNLYDEMIAKRAHTVFSSVYDLDENQALQSITPTHTILFSGDWHDNQVANPDLLTYEEAFSLHRWYQHQLDDLQSAHEAHGKLLALLDTQFKNDDLFLFDEKQDDLKTQCAVLYAQIQPYLMGLHTNDSLARMARFDKGMAHVLSGDRCAKPGMITYFLTVAEVKALLTQSKVMDTTRQNTWQARAALYADLATKNYRTAIQGKELVAQEIYDGCAVVHLSQKPNPDDQLSVAGKHAAAYVRVSRFENDLVQEDKLYYLNKQTKEFKELSLTPKQLRIFDQQFQNDQTLPVSAYKKIETLTGQLYVPLENRKNYVMKHTEVSKKVIALRKTLDEWVNVLSEPLKQKLQPLPQGKTYTGLEAIDDVLAQSQQVVLLKRLFNLVSQLEASAKQLELLNKSELKEITLTRVGTLYWQVQDILALSQNLRRDPYFSLISEDVIHRAKEIQQYIVLQSAPYSKSAIDVRPITIANQYSGLWCTLNAVMIIPDHIRALEQGDALKDIGHELETRQVSENFDFKTLRPGQPLLIKQGERYFIFGNSKGAVWKLTELDAPVIESANINFMKAERLPYHQKYEDIYKNIIAKEGHTTKLDALQMKAKKATLNIETIIQDANSYFRLFLDSLMIYGLFFELKDQLTLLTTTAYQSATTNLDNINKGPFTRLLLEADAWESRLNLQPGLISSPMKALLDEFYRGLVSPLVPEFKPQMALVSDFSPLNQRVYDELNRLAVENETIHVHERHLVQLDAILEQLKKAYYTQNYLESFDITGDPKQVFYHQGTCFLPQLNENFKQILPLFKLFNQFAEKQDLSGLGLLDLKNAMKRIVRKGYDAPDICYSVAAIPDKDCTEGVLHVHAVEHGLAYQINPGSNQAILRGIIPFSALNFAFTQPITQAQIDASTLQILSYAASEQIIRYGDNIEKMLEAVGLCRHHQAGLLDTAKLAKETSQQKLDFLNDLRVQQLRQNEVLKANYAKQYLKKEVHAISDRTLGLIHLAEEYRQKLDKELLSYKTCDICLMSIERAQQLGKRSCYVWDNQKKQLAYLPSVGDAESIKLKNTENLEAFLTKNARKVRLEALSVSHQDIEKIITTHSEHTPKFDLFVHQLNGLEQVDVDIHDRLQRKARAFETKHIRDYYKMEKVIIAIHDFQAYLASNLTSNTPISPQDRSFMRAKQSYLDDLERTAHDTTQPIDVRYKELRKSLKANEEILVRYHHRSIFTITGLLQYLEAVLHSVGLWTSSKRQHYESLMKVTQETPDMQQLTQKFGLFYGPNLQQQQPKTEGEEPENDPGIEHLL